MVHQVIPGPHPSEGEGLHGQVDDGVVDDHGAAARLGLEGGRYILDA